MDDSGNDSENRKVRLALTGVLGAILVLAAIAEKIADKLGLSPWVFWVPLIVGAFSAAWLLILNLLDLFDASPTLRSVATVLVASILAATAGGLAGKAMSSPRTSGFPVYAKRLTTIFRELRRIRDKAYSRLVTAKTPATQAEIAAVLSDGFSLHATALRRAAAPRADAAINRRLAGSLTRLADAYANLSHTATAQDGSQAKLDRSRRRVRHAERGLEVAERALTNQGYTVEAIPTFQRGA